MPEMKDSGTTWLGTIPQSWELSRIGSLYQLRITKVSDKDYPPLSVTNRGIVPQLESAAKTNSHDDRKLVKRGDFAINSRSDRRGSCGISPYDGSVSLINTILAPREEMNPKYYDWLFHTVQFGDEFYKWGHGIVDDLWTTGWQDMKKILIPVPSLVEQEQIANFLDGKCSEIDALLSDIQSEIEILEEYKKSVITEAVTKGLNPDVKMKDSGIEYVGYIPSSWEIHPVYYYFGERKAKNYALKEQNLLSLSYGKIIRNSINEDIKAVNDLLDWWSEPRHEWGLVESGIHVKQCDITALECDAIVNAANKSLLGGGGVDGAIHRAAGPELLKECRTLNGCETGEAKITKGYRLPARYVIHTVGPIYSGSDSDARLLAACYRNSLDLAKENNLHSIAFPAISTGVYGYPLADATGVAVGAVKDWMNLNNDYAMDITFCCFDQRTSDIYNRELKSVRL